MAHGHRGRGGRRAEQVVAAPVARAVRHNRTMRCRAALLAEAGQRVKLPEQRDHRGALPVGRDERRRHPGDAALHREPGGLERVRERGAAARLVQAQLGRLPDSVGELAEQRRLFGHKIKDGR